MASQHKGRTTDEFGLLIRQLLGDDNVAAVNGSIVSCVVPATLYSITKACRRYLDVEPLVVGSGVKTGMKVRTDNPREVGADRIVNSVRRSTSGGRPWWSSTSAPLRPLTAWMRGATMWAVR